MRTIIRLRRFGEKNKPKYKLIVQGHYKRLKGRYIEHLGYWFPVKVNEHDRSIILNKSRLRYWVGTGAVYSPKVQKLLSFMDIAPAPWVSFGTQTLYKNNKEQFTRLSSGIKKIIDKAGESTYNERYMKKIRAHDEENLLLRRVKFARSMNQYIDEKEIIVEEKGVAEDDIKARTEKFLKLKKIYDDIEAKDPLLSPLKREMLYRKMNELASMGLLSEKEQKEVNATSEEAIVNLYEERNKKAYEALLGAVNLFEPITKEEFIEIAKIHVFAEDLDDYFDSFFYEKEQSGKPLTKADLHIFCRIFSIDHDTDILTSYEKEKIEKNDIAPTRYPLTPFPDVNDYDPKDWFDLDDDNTYNISHTYKGEDKWFNLPLTKKRQEQFEEMRSKQFRDFITVNSKLKHD